MNFWEFIMQADVMALVRLAVVLALFTLAAVFLVESAYYQRFKSNAGIWKARIDFERKRPEDMEPPHPAPGVDR